MQAITRHAVDRLRTRGIHPVVIQLALREGVPLDRNPDRLLLGRKQLLELRHEGRVSEGEFNRAEKCGPVVCVVQHGVLITAFRAHRRIGRGR